MLSEVFGPERSRTGKHPVPLEGAGCFGGPQHDNAALAC